jgi:hypothetical protein
MGWTAWVRFPALQDFYLLLSVQTGFGVQPASSPTSTGALSKGVSRQECEDDHSPLFIVEVKKGGAIPPLPHMSSWRNG